MAEPKTKKTEQSPEEFLKTIEPEQKREDGLTLLKMFEKATGEKAVMWGSSLIGFGEYTYTSGGKELKWFLSGFSPRKQALTLYIMSHYRIGGLDKNEELLKKLGKYKTSQGAMGGCMYINKLADVDLGVLAQIIENSYKDRKESVGAN